MSIKNKIALLDLKAKLKQYEKREKKILDNIRSIPKEFEPSRRTITELKNIAVIMKLIRYTLKNINGESLNDFYDRFGYHDSIRRSIRTGVINKSASEKILKVIEG